MKKIAALWLLTLNIYGCGGSGGETSSSPTPVKSENPLPTPTPVIDPGVDPASSTTTTTTTTVITPTTTTTIVIPSTTTTLSAPTTTARTPTTTTRAPTTTTRVPTTTTTTRAATTTTRVPTTTTRAPTTTTTTRAPTTTTQVAATTTTTTAPTTTTTTLNPTATSAPLRIEKIGDAWTYNASFVTGPLLSGFGRQVETGTLTKRVIGQVLNLKGTTCLVEEMSGVITNTSTSISRTFSETTLFYQDQTGTRFYCGEIIQEGADQVVLFIRLGFGQVDTGLLTMIRSPLIVGESYTGFSTHIYKDGSSYGTAMDHITKVERQRPIIIPMGEFDTHEVQTRRIITDDDYISSITWINPEIGTVLLTRKTELIEDCQCLEDIPVTRITSSLALTLTGYNFAQ